MKATAKEDRKMRLALLRHAKSVREEGPVDDLDRPLAARGIEAARMVGQVLRERKLIPDLVLCSPAARARETWALVAAQLPSPSPVSYIDALYDFGDGTAVLDVIRQSGGTAQDLMIVGHNPALENLAASLAGPGGDSLRLKMRSKFPTAALALFDCRISRWADLAPAACDLTEFIRPADLRPD